MNYLQNSWIFLQLSLISLCKAFNIEFNSMNSLYIDLLFKIKYDAILEDTEKYMNKDLKNFENKLD